VQIDSKQFGYKPMQRYNICKTCHATDARKVFSYDTKVWMAFVAIQKAFINRVPLAVMWWTLRNLRAVVSFSVRDGVHQASVLSLLLFTVVMDAMSREFSTGLSWQLLSADDQVLIAKSEKFMEKLKLMEKLRVWKKGLEEKGLKVNVVKTKIMRYSDELRAAKESGKFACATCLKGISSKSFHCAKYKMWVYKNSGVKEWQNADKIYL
jgi:Reverse transcriptase (RNA-dependent DNA polymerase)